MDRSRRSFIRRAIGVGTSGTAFAAVNRPGDSVAQSAQSPGVQAFDHVALPMQNVDQMLAFYRALGFQVVEGTQVCSVHFGNQMINLHRPALWQNATFTLRAPAAKPPCGDLCFVWNGSPESLAAALGKANARVETGPVGRQGGRRTTGSSVYTRDPDGNLLEFMIYS